MKTPSPKQLRYFIELAKTPHYRQAAQKLGISQPTLTTQIRTMEEGLELSLFERSRSGTRLTPEGRALLKHAKSVEQSLQAFSEKVQSITKGRAITYRLGVPPTLGPYLLPYVLPDLHQRDEMLKLYVREAAPQVLTEHLLNGDYDLVLSPITREQPDLHVMPLFREPLKFVMPADHHLAKLESITAQDLQGQDVLSLQDHHHFHTHVQALCQEFGANLLRDYEGTSLDTLRQMVVMGLGVTFLPGLYIHSELHCPEALKVCRVIDKNITRAHALMWRASSPNRNYFREVAKHLKSIIHQHLSDVVDIIES